MQLEHESRDGIDIIRLNGRLLMADAADAKQHIKDILLCGSGNLIVDLTRLEYTDTSGVAMLVSSMLTARKKGGDVYLFGMSNTIRALFELTRLHTMFAIFDDEEAALRAIH